MKSSSWFAFARSSIPPRMELKSPCLLSTRRASNSMAPTPVSSTAMEGLISPSRQATASPGSSSSAIWAESWLSPTFGEEESTGRPGTKVRGFVQPWWRFLHVFLNHCIIYVINPYQCFSCVFSWHVGQQAELLHRLPVCS